MSLVEPLYIQLHLTMETRRVGKTFESVCPLLDLWSQGDYQSESRDNLKEAVELWFESCIERGTLKEALSEVE